MTSVDMRDKKSAKHVELVLKSEQESSSSIPDTSMPPHLSSSSLGRSYRCKSLEWRIDDYTVNLGKGKTRTILSGIVGRADGGSFVGIIGPSGSGKTSMIDCLALRQPAFRGGLHVDGHPIHSDYFAHSAYVHQTETFMSHLTCREHLTFHVINRMSYKYSHDKCIARVEEVLEEVDLLKVAESQIGGGAMYFVKGLSGGERKRLSIATEMLSDPSLLFLDEPTSGLDAVMGELVCALLRDLACTNPNSGRIVMAALHTPSSKVFQMFSHLLILTSKGRLAYYGLRDELLPHLESLGYTCPPNFNPADFVLELASAKVIQYGHDDLITSSSSNGRAGRSSEEGKQQQSDADGEVKTQHVVVMGGKNKPNLVETDVHDILVRKCAELLVPNFRASEITPVDSQPFVSVGGGRSTIFTQFRTNMWRTWLQESREVMGYTIGIAMSLAMGLLYGIAYMRQLEGNIRNTGGFLFSMNVTLIISASVAVTLQMPTDFQIILREYYTGCNSAVPYFLGRSLAAIPFSIIYMAMAVVPYYMIGLQRDLQSFAWFCLVCLLQIFGSQSVGYLASSCSVNPVVGLALLPVMITPMVLFSGLLYERHTVPPYLIWLQDISLVNYSYGALVINEARSNKKIGVWLLKGLQLKESDLRTYVGLLLVLGVGYRVLALLQVMYRIRITKST